MTSSVPAGSGDGLISALAAAAAAGFSGRRSSIGSSTRKRIERNKYKGTKELVAETLQIGRGEVGLANCLFRQRQVRRSECNNVALRLKPATVSIRQGVYPKNLVAFDF
jgi:hypothetical protein